MSLRAVTADANPDLDPESARAASAPKRSTPVRGSEGPYRKRVLACCIGRIPVLAVSQKQHSPATCGAQSPCKLADLYVFQGL
jgi:hypothetical protein